MLIDEARGVVDLVVDDQVEVFLARVLRDFGEAEFFRHGDGLFDESTMWRRFVECVSRTLKCTSRQWLSGLDVRSGWLVDAQCLMRTSFRCDFRHAHPVGRDWTILPAPPHLTSFSLHLVFLDSLLSQLLGSHHF